MQKYNSMEDNQIIECINIGDDDAMEFIIKKYGNLVRKEARKFYLIGAESEDLYQEGMIGLFKAIRSYDPSKNASFLTFATLCVSSKIKTVVTASNRKKSEPLNKALSINSDDSGYLYFENEMVSQNSDNNPLQAVLNKEDLTKKYERINKELSPLEKKVLSLYLDGLSYFDISIRLGKTAKSVDNAIQRIKSKLSKA